VGVVGVRAAEKAEKVKSKRRESKRGES